MSVSASYESPTALDSHADMTVLGKHYYMHVVVYDTNRTVDVSPFLSALGTVEKTRIVTGAITYYYPDGMKRLSWL